MDHGHRDWDDIPVLCGAEGVLEADRAVLSKAFGPEIHDTYGSRETMLIAAECGAHAGLHLSEENLVVEVVANGKATADGDPGDVVITDLHNYGMPFIRYQNGDVARTAKGDCACGRGLRRLARVDGRHADMLRDPQGNTIPGIVFHVLLSDARREVVRKFQVVQRRSGDVVLRVVRGREWSADAWSILERRFRDYLRGAPFTVEYCDDIAPAANGKMKTILVEPPQSL
jgi:phenylacetate-CoA ligase